VPAEIAFRITAFGEVTQQLLEQLREDLGFKRAGRLTDVEDEGFGYRTERVGDGDGDETEVRLRLSRDGVNTWSFWVAYLGETPPSDALIDDYRAAFLRAIEHAGLVVAREYRP
jgi:hypothetical protein